MSTKSLKAIPRWVLCALGAGLLFWALMPLYEPTAMGDPDYYYHVALGKMTAEQGPIRELPQVEDLGWGEYFPDKEFLFHVITGIAHKLGGEKAISSLPLLFCVAITLSLISLALNFSQPPVAIASVFIGVFTTYPFLFRLYLLRPHSLAILIFIWIVIALIRKNKWLLMLMSLLFALSYHALYLPLIPAAIYLLLPGSERRASLKLCAWAVVGLIAGTLINPYFPSNILMGIRHMWIALTETNGNVDFGLELIPLRSDIYVKNYLFHWGISLFALYKVAKKGTANSLLICALSLIFLLMTALSPRAIEYGAPMAAVSIAILVKAIAGNRMETSIAGVFAILSILLANIQNYRDVLNVPKEMKPKHFAERLLKTVEALPEDGSSKKVFNFEWSISPYILYKRPSYRFLDILDPSFLINNGRDLYNIRENMTEGLISDPYNMIKVGYGSDYVVTMRKSIADRLKSELGFKLISNPDPKLPIEDSWAFYLDEPEYDNFVREYEGHYFPSTTAEDFLALLPKEKMNWEPVVSDIRGSDGQILWLPYLNLLEWVKQTKEMISSDKEKVICAGVRPQANALKTHQGKTIMAVGGGRNIRIWLNGRPFFNSVSAPKELRKIYQLIRMPHPLAESDRIEAIVCSQSNSPFMGVALSFWREEEIQDLCSKKVPKSMKQNGFTDWDFTGVQEQTCLGPLAIPKTRNSQRISQF